eukprot:g2283.t1
MARAQFFCAKHDPKYKCTNPGSVSYCASLTDPKFPLYKCISGVECKQPTPPPTPPPTPAPTPINHEFQAWLQSFGHDDFEYPEWVADQKHSCNCTGILSTPECYETTATGDVSQVDWRGATELTWCVAKQWLLEHMPSFDKVSEIQAHCVAHTIYFLDDFCHQYFLPPSVTITGASMFDDNIAFALMADDATKSTYGANIPLAHKLAYVLPYATYHESRVNWRPLFFAKYFKPVADAATTAEAIKILTSPPFHSGLHVSWSNATWAGEPGDRSVQNDVVWGSSTSPPVISPFDWAAYGYASCTGWAAFLTYMARAVGIPARPVGTPCWNADEFAGLAKDNPNVSKCWHGGNGTRSHNGGRYLFNHNWLEFYDDINKTWVFVNVPDTPTPDTGLCSFDRTTGCNYDSKGGSGCSKVTSGPGNAGQDHEIFAPTWSSPGESTSEVDGGTVVDVKDLRLTSGEAVSPLVWSPSLASVAGEALKDDGLRVVNRSDFYRCKEP